MDYQLFRSGGTVVVGSFVAGTGSAISFGNQTVADTYTVVATNKGNYDEVINGTIAAYRAKKQPHIVQVYERGFMTMLLSEAIVPVHQLMADKGYKIDWNDFVKPVAGFYTYKGKLMTMPFNSSTPILWYNKDHFAKAGFDKPAETWQELEKQLYAIKQKGIAECGSSLAGDQAYYSGIEEASHFLAEVGSLAQLSPADREAVRRELIARVRKPLEASAARTRTAKAIARLIRGSRVSIP